MYHKAFQRLLYLSPTQIDLPLQQEQGKALIRLPQRGEDFVYMSFRRKGSSQEIVHDAAILFAAEQDAIRLRNRSTRASYLLVIVNNGAWALIVDDKAQVRLIEAHAKSSSRH